MNPDKNDWELDIICPKCGKKTQEIGGNLDDQMCLDCIKAQQKGRE